MKNYMRAGIIFALLILVGVGAYFGISNLSVTSNEIAYFPDASCSIDSDCDAYFLSHGVSQSDLDEQKQIATIECASDGYCIARRI